MTIGLHYWFIPYLFCASYSKSYFWIKPYMLELYIIMQYIHIVLMIFESFNCKCLNIDAAQQIHYTTSLIDMHFK